MKNAKQNLIEWIKSNIKKEQFKKELTFNVHAFSEYEKFEAMKVFKNHELSNFNNHLLIRL